MMMTMDFIDTAMKESNQPLPRFQVTTKDKRLAAMLSFYPKSWHKQIKTAFALGYDDAIDELWENMPELTLGEITI